jgi:aminopeptidase N
MLSIFSSIYGLYPFIKEKYGHASMGSGGAMEHQTMTTSTTFREFIIAHELAHQWFGDMITCRSWRDLWLNEGFASYSEAVYSERQYGELAYHGYMGGFLSGAHKAIGPLRPIDTSSVANLFATANVYDKGASVLHMLRHVLGDSVFFQSIKAYADEPSLRFGTATTDDFRSVCERVSGKSLGRFFSQWTDGEGYPSYSFSWKSAMIQGAWQTTIRVSQTNGIGGGTIFAMPIEFKCIGSNWDSTIVAPNDGAVQTYLFSFPQRPLQIRLDPDSWLLADIYSENDATLPAALRLSQNYPNPFNPSSTIEFDLPRRSNVVLAVYNILGAEVIRLIDARMEPGHHVCVWDGTARGRTVASGAYICRLKTDEGSQTIRLMKIE